MNISKWYNQKRKSKKVEQLNKICKFPGCNKAYVGTGKSVYCLEHRQRKYRKIIDFDKHQTAKKEEELKNSNQTIKNKVSEPQTIIQKCALKNCNNTFEIRIIHNIKVYPKYCECHRNEWKRKVFMEKHND
jgi:hypothetical protein